MNRQAGFILPFVSMISFFLLLIILHLINIYHVEQLFLEEKIAFYELESLNQLSAVQISEEIAVLDETMLPLNGMYSYPHGEVSYEVETYNTSLLKISLFSRTFTDREDHVLILYDNENNKIVRWVEG
jgi:hypothetical protein